MTNPESCAFCDRPSLEWRTIRAEDLFTSFVSQPRFREGHCLVIPNRHITTIEELKPEEALGMLGELGRLACKLDEGSGYGMMHKYQPLQAENGIKVGHMHWHVVPCIENETGLFPVPEPNSFDGFQTAPADEVAAMAAELRPQ